MAIEPIVEVSALDGLQTYFQTFPDTANQAARLALNSVAKGKGMTLIRRNMMDQINFTRAYLTGDRLGIARYATDSRLEVVIRARDRATSLARFASGSPGSTAKKGVMVRVKKGRTLLLKRSWLVRLKAGASLSEDNYNVGLAVRLGPGEKITKKKTDHQSWLVKGSVALLYGPSVAQVFDDIRNEVTTPIADLVEAEFLRQLARIS